MAGFTGRVVGCTIGRFEKNSIDTPKKRSRKIQTGVKYGGVSALEAETEERTNFQL